MLKCRLIMLLALTAVAVVSAFGQPQQDQNGVWVDKKPLKQFELRLKNEVKAGKLDLEAPFAVEFEGTLNDQNNFDASSSRVTRSEGNDASKAAAKAAIDAIGESGFLGYLKQLDPKISKVLISLSQTAESFDIVMKNPVQSAETARTHAAGLQTLFSVGATMGNRSDADKLLLQHTRAVADGSVLTIRFSAPAAEFREILKKKLGSE